MTTMPSWLLAGRHRSCGFMKLWLHPFCYDFFLFVSFSVRVMARAGIETETLSKAPDFVRYTGTHDPGKPMAMVEFNPPPSISFPSLPSSHSQGRKLDSAAEAVTIWFRSGKPNNGGCVCRVQCRVAAKQRSNKQCDAEVRSRSAKRVLISR